MTDAETRAELERIDLELAQHFELLRVAFSGAVKIQGLNALRLLAESQKALREIDSFLMKAIHVFGNAEHDDKEMGVKFSELFMIQFVEDMQTLQKLIAKNACKGEYQEPKIEPILPVSLKCKCGYILKPQDKSCPNCDKLFGKKGGSNG